MEIIIENCSSPGASFTTNTDSVLFACYEWITENIDSQKPFISFRREVSEAKNFNDNNARNIYPLLKKTGFINYEAGGILKYSDFFTRIGLAYAKALETEKLIECSDYSEEKKNASLKKLYSVKSSLVYQGLFNLFEADSNYKEEMKAMLHFLLKYEKINKTEFAFLLYSMSKSENYIDEMGEAINQYRDGDLEISVNVDVRNDIELRDRTGNTRRKEGLSFLTAYTYFIALYEQAGLVYKDKKYMVLCNDAKEKIQKILEV